ncbi:aquaporin-11 isoform X2 [Heterodontus francisci]|uniref:aquaporin-11 isoform X2 n=1 Tax=Heterodontus francisci TaxID=7792 RepID=UPI00355C97E6
MEDCLVSIGVLAGTVMVCHVLRRTARELLCPRWQSGGRQSHPRLDPVPLEVAEELFSTLQLCICTHELQLLGGSGLLGQTPAFGLTYLITLVHLTTFGSACCNPVSCLEQFLHGQCSGQVAIAKVLAQLGAASVARRVSEIVWELDMSDLHWHHHQWQYECASTLNTNPGNGLVVEFACAFALKAVLFRSQCLKQKHKIHVVATLITFLVFAAGDLTGAMLNPALAYSVTFNCKGNTYLEYCFVYWLGPLMAKMYPFQAMVFISGQFGFGRWGQPLRKVGALTAMMLFDTKYVSSDKVSTETQATEEKRD